MATSERRRVLVVDDHSIVRFGLKQLLEQTGEFNVVGMAGDGEEAVRVTLELLPEIVVMDVMLPKKDGVEACKEIVAALPDTRVIMLTVSTEEHTVMEAIAAGAIAYLHKETGLDRLLTVMRGSAAGELFLPADIVRKVFRGIRNARSDDAATSAGLTKREREILIAFAGGMSYAGIADQRGVKPVTVRNAVYGIQSKLGVASMQELVLWAARNGLTEV